MFISCLINVISVPSGCDVAAETHNATFHHFLLKNAVRHLSFAACVNTKRADVIIRLTREGLVSKQEVEMWNVPSWRLTVHWNQYWMSVLDWQSVREFQVWEMNSRP